MENNFLVLPEEEGKRLDQIIAARNPEQSRSYFQRVISDGAVTVNGTVAKPSRIMAAEEAVVITMAEAQKFPAPSALGLPVLFEDEHVIVINKPAGLIVHPTTGKEPESVVQALLHLYPGMKEALYDPESAISRLRPGIVHRLDKDTSGALVVAKTRQALLSLAEQFHSRTVKKEYAALVSGKLEKPQTIDVNLQRKATPKKNIMGITKEDGEGRTAITHIAPMATYQDGSGHPASLISCQIETGRTHQIRVHCKYAGYAVLGDDLYFSKLSRDLSRHLSINRQMLHAAKLSFLHPVSGQLVQVEAPLPPDMQAILTKLKAT